MSNKNEKYSLLAGRYVLGLIQGRARSKFNQLAQDDLKMQKQIQQWEQYFYQFDQAITPITPPKSAWSAIINRLNGKQTAPRFWDNLFIWKTMTVGFILMSLLLSFELTQSFQQTPTYDYISIIQNKAHQPLWLINASLEKHQITIKTLNPAQTIGKQQDFELWLLPKSKNEKPLSMGLLPKQGDKEIRLAQQFIHLSGANKIAVSLEPLGGSPINSPTGTILFVADFMKTNQI